MLLIPGLLVGCGQETGNPPVSKETRENITENISGSDGQNSQNLEESFKDIQETYKQFQELVESFLGEIDEVRNGSKNQELVNSNEVNKKLKELEAKINQYQNNLPTTDAEVSELFEEINLIIVNNIKPITEQLKEGLGKESIGQVQLYFGGIVSGPSSKYYGVLGPGTTAKIKESFRGNSQQLEDKLAQLPGATDLSKELASTKTIEALSAEVAILKTEVKKLRNKNQNNEEEEIATISRRLTAIENQLEQKNSQVAMSVVALGLAVISTCFSLYKLFGQTRTDKQAPVSGTDKEYNPAIQADRAIKEYISGVEANQKVDEQFDTRYNYEDKISNRSKNIPQAEQNKGVNIQQNTFQSNVTTPRAKPAVPPVETRQHQQTYSLEYPSSSGSQLMSASNNYPLSFSNNGIAVEETKQSIEQRRLGGNKPIVFQKNRRGNYSVVKEGAVEYMVPKSKLKINEFNRQTVEVLFECQGYRPEYSGFKVIKPAIVSSASRGEVWQLVEPGVLQFY